MDDFISRNILWIVMIALIAACGVMLLLLKRDLQMQRDHHRDKMTICNSQGGIYTQYGCQKTE